MKSLQNDEILAAVITATILFFLLSVFILVYFLINRRQKKQHQLEMTASKEDFQRQLSQSKIEVQESTYRHIANEIHDNVGQLLSTVKMLIGVTEKKLGEVPDTLQNANTTLSKAIHELRYLSRSLDSEWLGQFDFLDNLKDEIDRINSANVRATIQCDTEINLSSQEQIIIFRIVQEAIQNAVRHANPTEISVAVRGFDGVLELQVCNNGRPLPEGFQGMGTNNMKQRTRLFGGSIQWLSLPESTRVLIKLPIKSYHENQGWTG